ncbi:MAG: hypothetical protein IT184_03565 [Acidobacteria bacterium]|nr:hypothetical protein [Acidobacteriota bacterium]
MTRRAPDGPPRRAWRWPLLIVALLALRLPALVEPAGSDQYLYQYVGERILAGAVPYVDAWDQKPPGIFFVYALVRLAWPRPSATAVADLAAAALLAVGLVALGRRTAAPAIGWIAAALALLWGHPAISRLGGVYVRGQCESFIAPAVVFALVFAAARPRTWRTAASAGALVAAAFWLKYNALAYALPVTAALLWPTRGDTREIRAALAWLAAGFAAVSTVVLVYFAAHGALEPLRMATLDYNLQYSGETYSGPLSVMRYMLGIPLERGRADMLWYLGLAGAMALIALRRERAHARAILACAWIAAAVLSIATNGARNLPQYFVQAVPALAFAGANGFSALWAVRRVGPALVVLLLAVGVWRVGVEAPSFVGARWATLPQLADNLAWDIQYIRGTMPRETYLQRFTGAQKYDALEIDRLTSRVAATTTSPDRILVFGFAPAVYVNAGRSSASRFFWSRPVVVEFAADRPGYGSAGLLRDLQATPPALVVLQKKDWGPMDPDSAAFFLSSPLLSPWLSTHYSLDAETPLFSVWRRND